MKPPDTLEVRAWLAKVAEDARVAEVLATLAEPRLPAEVDEAPTYLTEHAVLPRYPPQTGQRAPDRAERARLAPERVFAWIELTYGW